MGCLFPILCESLSISNSNYPPHRAEYSSSCGTKLSVFPHSFIQPVPAKYPAPISSIATMHINVTHIITFTTLLTTVLAAPMWKEGGPTCGPEEDLACYGDGSNGKRSALPEPAPLLPEPEACGPATDHACYPNSIEKRSDSSLDARRPPTLTATKATIPPLGAPTGFDGGGYLRRSKPTTDSGGIVIGSKSKRSPEPPEVPEDVGAYDEEKRRRSLSLDAEGHAILTGAIPPPVDKEIYPMVKSKRERPVDAAAYTEDLADYPIVKVKSKRERPIDTTGYDEDRNSYAVVKVKSKREREIDFSDYPADFGVYPEERKREANPAPLEKIEIDGDYPKPDDSSYPVKAKRMQKLDTGDYAPPDDVRAYGPEK
jgi:hypothetical protein